MKLEEKLNLILPPVNGIYAHITGEFGEPRPNGKTHKGIDFNYMGGQSGLNLKHPKIYSPVEGEVIFVGGNFGTIKIKDQQGFSHEVLHTHKQFVKVGEIIKLGAEIGTMGGKGPLGFDQYPQHVHYQIKNSVGVIENPKCWWAKQPTVEDSLISGKETLDFNIQLIAVLDLKAKENEKWLNQEMPLQFEEIIIENESNLDLSKHSLTSSEASFVFMPENPLSVFEIQSCDSVFV